MHFSTSREERHPGLHGLRWHGWFDLPLNPVCWLFGHKARVKVVEPTYSKPWRLVECRVCGRRYSGRDYQSSAMMLTRKLGGPDAVVTRRQLMDLEQAEGERLVAGQVEYARTNPREVAQSCSGREGYGNAQLVLGAELWARHPRFIKDRLGVRFHIGGRGSETPFDWHVDLGVVAGYFSIGGVGGRFCQWLGRGHGRDLSLALHNGKLWWKVWYDGDCGNDEHHRCDKRRPAWWSRETKYRSWRCLRDGSLAVNPLDYVFGGELKYSYEDVGPKRDAFVTVGPTTDLVTFQLQRQFHARPRGPKRMSWVASWEANPGIRVRNHDWKGDTILGSAEPVSGRTNWLPEAVASLERRVARDREHYRWNPDLPVNA